jgi:hypothetical protein
VRRAKVVEALISKWIAFRKLIANSKGGTLSKMIDNKFDKHFEVIESTKKTTYERYTKLLKGRDILLLD